MCAWLFVCISSYLFVSVFTFMNIIEIGRWSIVKLYICWKKLAKWVFTKCSFLTNGINLVCMEAHNFACYAPKTFSIDHPQIQLYVRKGEKIKFLCIFNFYLGIMILTGSHSPHAELALPSPICKWWKSLINYNNNFFSINTIKHQWTPHMWDEWHAITCWYEIVFAYCDALQHAFCVTWSI